MNMRLDLTHFLFGKLRCLVQDLPACFELSNIVQQCGSPNILDSVLTEAHLTSDLSCVRRHSVGVILGELVV